MTGPAPMPAAAPPAGVHPWHDIPVGPKKKAPDVVHAVIEIPEGSKVKFEIDKVLSRGAIAGYIDISPAQLLSLLCCATARTIVRRVPAYT